VKNSELAAEISRVESRAEGARPTLWIARPRWSAQTAVGQRLTEAILD